MKQNPLSRCQWWLFEGNISSFIENREIFAVAFQQLKINMEFDQFSCNGEN
jgi:hypothetical protein